MKFSEKYFITHLICVMCAVKTKPQVIIIYNTYYNKYFENGLKIMVVSLLIMGNQHNLLY